MRHQHFLKTMMAVLVAMTMPLPAMSQMDILGDYDYDGRVNVSDVTALISYVLTGSWDDMPQVESETVLVNGVPLVMVHVEGGSFTVDEVTYNVPGFWIGQTEVTNALYKAVMEPSSAAGGSETAQSSVSYNQWLSFITALCQQTGMEFRLPKLSEWRFAALGGNRSSGYTYPGSDNHMKVAWSKNNPPNPYGYEPSSAKKVAQLKCNELGLYDMGGNVGEFCTSGSDVYYCGGSFKVAGEQCVYTNAIKHPNGMWNTKYAFMGVRLVLPEEALPLGK